VFRLTPFRTYVDGSQVKQVYIKIGAQIRTYDAGDVFELLNCRNQEVALENISEISKQIDPGEVDESEPEHKEMSVTFTEDPGIIAAGTMVL
jgi:hypothetical protein